MKAENEPTAETTANSTPHSAVVVGLDHRTPVAPHQPANSQGNLYVAVQDSAGKTATAANPTAVTSAAWTPWKIPLSSFAGVNMSKVKKLYIGVDNRTDPTKGGAGKLYIDDIGYGRSLP